MKNATLILLLLCLLTSCASTKKIANQSSNVNSISASRDGSSFEKAIVIDETKEKPGVDAEYAWIKENYPGSKLNGQTLSNYKKEPFDIIDILTIDGQSKRIYFNISKFYGKF